MRSKSSTIKHAERQELCRRFPRRCRPNRRCPPSEELILFFSVASVHDLHDELQSWGYDASAPAAEFPDVHEMHLHDPDSYALAFTSPIDVGPGDIAG